ncbi:MAG: apolipoprotein N-acyltransferase, partial [Pirellula sp.]
ALRSGPVDLVIWPESVFAGTAPYMIWDRGPSVPSQLNMDRERLDVVYRNLSLTHLAKLQRLTKIFDGRPPKFLMGTDVWNVHDGELERYNAALWIDPEKRFSADTETGSVGNGLVGRSDASRAYDASESEFYAKNHLVMFGEYIPILSWIPGAMQALGLGELASGKSPKAWRLANGTRVAPSVCFEDFVPHLMRSHVQRLIRSGSSPDVLVNISNDGWFRGSSILDHHFNSAILTAVENRMPLLVASNTGITAWVDGDGRVVKRLPKMEAGWIVAEPIPDGRVGWWAWWGDMPARGVAAVGLFPCISWCIRRLRSRGNGASQSRLGD